MDGVFALEMVEAYRPLTQSPNEQTRAIAQAAVNPIALRLGAPIRLEVPTVQRELFWGKQ